jgi:hypothetical protein
LYNSYDEVIETIGDYFIHGDEPEGNRRLTFETQGKMAFDFIKQTSNDAWVCEIGSLYGHMTLAMAFACVGSNRRVVTIDHMIGHHCMPQNMRPKCIYLDLIDNLIHFGVWDKVVPFPMKSVGSANIDELKEELLPKNILEDSYLQAFEMLVTMGIEFEYEYIDGCHAYENVHREFELYTTLLKSGGVITGDDCQTYQKPFRETFINKGVFEGVNVARAVVEFFGDNDEFEPLDVPINQFGFRKL